MPKYSSDDATYRRLLQLINEWNDDHYDIFVLSEPNEVSYLFYFISCFEDFIYFLFYFILFIHLFFYFF